MILSSPKFMLKFNPEFNSMGSCGLGKVTNHKDSAAMDGIRCP